MTTLEDIYHPNERNRWFYAEKDECLVVCPLNIVGDISEHEISKIKTLYLTLHLFSFKTPILYENITICKNYYK